MERMNNPTLALYCLMACLIVLAETATAGQSETASPRNLLVNGDFDKWTGSEPDHWVAAEACRVGQSADGEGYGGSGHAVILRIPVATESWFYQYPEASYREGQYLRFTVWLKLDEQSPPGAVSIRIGSVDGPPPASRLIAGNLRRVRLVKGEYKQFAVVHQLAPGGKTFYAAIVSETPVKLHADKAVMQFVGREEAEKAIQEQKEKIEYINPVVPAVQLPKYQGQRYEAVVPDTLDLAERAALGVHGLTSTLDPQADYELYWFVSFHRNPPIMSHDFNDHVQIKFHEALPLLRQASGSRQNEEVDRRWMEFIIQMQGPDGLLYYPRIGRPWATAAVPVEQFGPMPFGNHYSEPYANGRLLGAIALYYETTGDERWKEVGKRVVDGLTKQAVHRDDYAYFSKGLFDVNEVSDAKAPLPDPWTRMTFGWITIGLAQFYAKTGYEPALALSGKIARFTRYHGEMFDADGRFVGIGMHFHGHLHPLLGMLEYGIAARDREMIEFARKGYEFSIPHMNRIVGYVPEVISPTATSEICGVADMIHMAVKLSLAGSGDYWDDVDRWTRNQFAEGQLTSSEWVYCMIKNLPRQAGRVGPESSTDKVPERCVGCFAGWPSANDWQGNLGYSIMHCCTGNGTRAIYFVWENILHYREGKLKVNLLLNRASPWADIDSSIPYQGRVDVKVKKPCELSLRIPEWVQPSQTTCQVDGATRALAFEGRYAVVGKVAAGSVTTLRFPIFERTDKVHIQNKDYTLIRKGNDVVHIDPPGRYCPLYQREKYRDNKVRTKKVERFVAEKQLAW